MTLYDYDLAILGATPSGRVSAALAARLRARVALIGIPDNQLQRTWLGLQILRTELEARSHLPSGATLQAGAEIFTTLGQRLAIATQGSGDWTLPQESETDLSLLGVDVIPGVAQWVQPGRGQSRWGQSRQSLALALQVKSWIPLPQDGIPSPLRQLTARRYLLAPQNRPQIPSQISSLPGLSEVETLLTWPHWESLPDSLIILGSDPWGLALAQILARLGCSVTVVTQRSHLLPHFDPELSTLLVGLLTAAGVTLRLGVCSVQLMAVQPAELQVDGQILGAERLLVATGWRSHWDGLNGAEMGLAELGLVKAETLVPHHLSVDAHLRTAHRQIYACGTALGGTGLDGIAYHEAQVATRNALWGNWWQPQYVTQPEVLWTVPGAVRLGLTEPQAKALYPHQVRILRTYPKDNLQAHLMDATTGLCKLVLSTSGQLLGAHLMGAQVLEWSGAIALALQKNGSIQDLARLPMLHPSFSTLIREAAAQYRWQRLAERPRREDLLERFFNWRRTGGI